MSLEKDIGMMVMLKKVKEMNMVNVVQNQDSFYQMLNTEIEDWQEKLQHHIGMNYVPNFTSTIPVTDYVYAYLDKNQELIISSVDLHPDDSNLYDKDSNFGKCELKDDDYQTWYKYRNDILTIRFEGIVKPITCSCWFPDCENLTEIKNIENLYTNECTNMSDMFYGCISLTTLDLSTFDTSNITDMSCMFYKCESLSTLNVGNFDTSNVTDMSGMFNYCTSLTTLDLSNFNTSKVVDMSYMFEYCTSLTTLDLSNFNTSKVINMAYMFDYCKSLTTLDLKNFDTSKVIDMDHMFYNCTSLTTLDLKNFDTINVTNMNHMFTYCISLTTLNLSDFDTSKVIDMDHMFYNCVLLTSITCSESVKDKITSKYVISSNPTWTII